MKRIAAALLCAVMAASCQRTTPTQPTALTQPTASATPSVAATAYLNNLIELMRNNSINRLTIDWQAFRNEVFSAAGAAQTIAELQPAIRVAITLLRDGHSSYRPATGTTIFVAQRSCVAAPLVTLTTPSNIATVRVTSFGGSGEPATAFARQIQGAIAAADRDDLIGWIVDLRSNGGGNMWPMIAGVGPLLGDGPLGYFINPLGTETPWEYRDGSSFSGGFPVTTVTPPYRLRRSQPRVAVLSNVGIASSGEATLIAFRLRPNTRSFGEATCGLSTANATYPLSDGATLTLTTSVMADRAKNRFGDRITPDEVLTDQAQAIQRAITWLQTGS
jgi:carboxyl-terminal processing protease